MGVPLLHHKTFPLERLNVDKRDIKECKKDNSSLRWEEMMPPHPHTLSEDLLPRCKETHPVIKGSSYPATLYSHPLSRGMRGFKYPLLALINRSFERSCSWLKDLSASHRKVYHKHNQWLPLTILQSFGMRSYIAWISLLLLIFVDMTSAGPHKCLLPSSWRGEWFHSGAQSPVVVDETSISHKGDCVRNLKDRYLFKNKHYGCFRCLVIHQKHDNVLQYKETYCDRSNSLVDVCSLLSGDAQLHSMFRLDAEPVPCPFPHTYTFTYNRGHGECAFPKSTVFSCTEAWRLLFRYQACPDVQGTESTTEELVCLAEWKEGSNRYLVGKSDHPLATSDEDRYRCFVYDTWDHRNESGFQVAQSGDATCNGLFSVNDGSRTLRLTKVDTSGTSCRFPSWASFTHWHSLDGGTSLHVIRKNSTLKLSGHSVTGGPATLACLTPALSTPNSATYITRVIHGCNSGYQCVHLLSRDSHVLEVIMGKVTLQLEEACSSHFFNGSSTNFTTFISNAAESRSCPGVGRYEVQPGTNSLLGGGSYPHLGRESMELPLGACTEELFTALTVGCSSSDTLEIHTSCSSSEYSCHGWWEEAGRQYLVVTPTSRSSKGVRRLCLVLDTGGTGSGALSLASSAQSCSRELTPGMHGRIALNTTSSGGCEAITASGAMSESVRLSPHSILSTLVLSALGMAYVKALSVALSR